MAAFPSRFWLRSHRQNVFRGHDSNDLVEGFGKGGLGVVAIVLENEFADRHLDQVEPIATRDNGQAVDRQADTQYVE